jgi:hypothetical protein
VCSKTADCPHPDRHPGPCPAPRDDAYCWCGEEILGRSIACSEHQIRFDRRALEPQPARTAELKALSSSELAAVCDEGLRRWVEEMPAEVLRALFF